MTKRISRLRRGSLAFTLAAGLAAAGNAVAGPTFTGPGDSSLTLGIWSSAAYTSAEQADGLHDSDLRLDSFRIITVAKFTKQIGLMTNFARLSGESMRLLDLVGQFELTDNVNLWVGRHVVPGDRQQMAGPYFANVWEYPMVSRNPNAYTGRDDGATLWGSVLDRRLQYMVGAFQGKNRGHDMSNESHQLLYATRFAWSFRDREAEYFNSNHYYGEKEVLTVGVAWRTQKDGVGTALTRGDYTAWSLDTLMQTRLQRGDVLTLEGAWYDYDTDDVADISPADPGCSRVTNCGGATAGNAYLLTAAWLFPTPIGIGRLEPHMRFQSFRPDTGARSDQWDIGVNYVISGHNARLSAFYSELDSDGVASRSRFIVGLQLMY
ncbi:hypothetical protein [Methyloversatilis sp.]|uniref:hypothetical protein n=1 Tax=Methyloversatilis sp. TaxID=2569862 RepID=UPI002732BBA3|nr:hypothetical protein [Methyloversatilis sp.]MDP2868964.1 hypothetical protein [Methyloversatilis sp.]MDP3454605.1 hypothetical protein [Methyloversatilis sp.]MDP3580185.1 hypothetical protein [Methyloversatilis sp.]